MHSYAQGEAVDIRFGVWDPAGSKKLSLTKSWTELTQLLPRPPFGDTGGLPDQLGSGNLPLNGRAYMVTFHTGTRAPRSPSLVLSPRPA